MPADPAGDAGALTIVLVGGGPTGVEMAGALSELITHNLARDFHYLDVSSARVVLVELTDHLLPGFSPASQRAALQTLEAKGVDVRLGLSLAEVTARRGPVRRRHLAGRPHRGVDGRGAGQPGGRTDPGRQRPGRHRSGRARICRFPGIRRCS